MTDIPFQIAGRFGRWGIHTTEHLFNLFAFMYRLLRMIAQRPPEGRLLVRRAIIEQIYFTAVQALTIVIPIALIIGTMLLILFALVATHYDLGKIAVFLVVRELAPIITALLVILRSATAVTIEIGYMRVLNEIEALEMAGIDPIRVLFVPRLLGITSAILFLFIVFNLVSILGGYFLVLIATELPVGNFLAQIGKAITGADIVVGLVKAVVFGIIITVVSIYHGLKMERRITFLPIALSKASVECFVNCLILNIMISIAFYI